MSIRQIRSFVRREGRITDSQKNALEKLWPLYGIDTALIVNSDSANAAKQIVEIGFGMGDSLLAMAEQFPDYQFIGIDIYRAGIGSVLNTLHQRNLKNIRLINDDAVNVLANFPNHSIDTLLIFFPDPWPKKRHHKRRLIQPDFINLVIKKLKVGGYLHIATDWKPYAEHIESVLSGFPHLETFADNRVMSRALTKFEQRGIRLGHEVYEFVRKSVV